MRAHYKKSMVGRNIERRIRWWEVTSNRTFCFVFAESGSKEGFCFDFTYNNQTTENQATMNQLMDYFQRNGLLLTPSKYLLSISLILSLCT